MQQAEKCSEELFKMEVFYRREDHLKVHLRNIRVQMTRVSRWLSCGISTGWACCWARENSSFLPLGQQSSCTSYSEVQVTSVGVCNRHLFLFEVIDVFLFGVIEVEWQGLRALCISFSNSNFSLQNPCKVRALYICCAEGGICGHTRSTYSHIGMSLLQHSSKDVEWLEGWGHREVCAEMTRHISILMPSPPFHCGNIVPSCLQHYFPLMLGQC